MNTKKHTNRQPSPVFLLEMYIASVYRTYPHSDVLRALDRLCDLRSLRKPMVILEEKKEKVDCLLPTLATPVAIAKEFGITYHITSLAEAEIMRSLMDTLLKIKNGEIQIEHSKKNTAKHTEYA